MAIDLTGIQNVGEFYSHHYLDALLENDLKALFARWRTDEEGTDVEKGTADSPDRALNRCATPFFDAKRRALRERKPINRYRASHHLHTLVLEALGYSYAPQVRYLADGALLPLLGAVARDGADYLWLLETSFVAGDASPLEQTVLKEQVGLPAPAQPQPKGAAKIGEVWVIPTAPWEELVGECFRVTNPPRWLILLAGRFIYLIDRTKWGQGQYLLFDLDEIFGRRERSTLRAAAALLAREALCPAEGVPLHDTLDENSHKHAYAVSSDLKFGARRAVELLANEYVHYQRTVAKQALFQDDQLAEKLTAEALTYLYRLLFLFYAEARGGELDLVPMKSEAFRTGYSLEALRDLEQTPLTTPQAQNGYFIHASLERLFRLMEAGFQPEGQITLLSPTAGQAHEAQAAAEESYDSYGFRMNGLHSPLFSRRSTPQLSAVKFRNSVLQEIIQLLSLSKEGKGRNSQRGRISYAQLGINQLGAVYEGLLSYTGFFAQETLYEVKPADKDPEREDVQTYFVPQSQLDRYTAAEFVYAPGPDGANIRKRYERGSFIFHLAGRNREKSASYYTPEVLTRCVVKYTLKEALQGVSADAVLHLLICEPAMGSAAFINELINQLADAYLERKQQEVGVQLPPDQYREERQRVKAYLASHNVYGVDLNPAAVELAQVSIWLNTIYRGAEAPWYVARLAVGNSLIGARRQVYTAEQLLSGDYANQAPLAVPLRDARPIGSVYHWLLPDKGMAAFDNDKVIKELAPAAVQAIKDWRKAFTKKLSKAEVATLQALSDRVDELWQQQVRDRQTLLARTATPIPVWGQPPQAGARNATIAGKQQALEQLNHPTSAYRRLKLAMDYWCALWFWPIPEAAQLPSRATFFSDLDELLRSEATDFPRVAEQLALYETDQASLSTVPEAPKNLSFADLKIANVDDLCRTNARLGVVAQVAQRQRFHHWELAFAEVFAERGGFDLIVGNPPWVKLTWNEGSLLSEYDPQLSIRKLSASDIANHRKAQLNISVRIKEYTQEFNEVIGILSFLNAYQNYPWLFGIQSNLYKCFITKSLTIGTREGVIGLLHPEGIYDDPKGGTLRSQIYPRLTAHFQFQNELKLFADVAHTHKFSVNIYRTVPQAEVEFCQIANLFLPLTVDLCFEHNHSSAVPGIRDDQDKWETRGHHNRIVLTNDNLLKLYGDLYGEPGMEIMEVRLPQIHSAEIARVLESFSTQTRKLGNLSGHYYVTKCWDETGARINGTIRRETRYPDSLEQWVISGPHFFVASPFNKTPNENCGSHGDYSDIDLTSIQNDYLPRTNYVRACSPDVFSERIPKWNGVPFTNYYRLVFRAMLNPVIERTLIGCIVPPKVSHINGVQSFSFDDLNMLVEFSGLSSSLLYDFIVRSTGKQNLHELPELLPLPDLDAQLRILLCCRNLRLNCLTIHFAELWQQLYNSRYNQDQWTKVDPRLKPWSELTPHWQRHVALRTPFERRQALVEIDVLAALALGLTLDELLTIYRVQFPVLQKNERRLRFDQRGMEVPMKTVGGTLDVDEGHKSFAQMVPPFTPVDREEDYRVAWRVFTARLQG